MSHAAKRCERLTAQQIEEAYERIDNGGYYIVPPGDFLSEPQDERGLPMSYSDEYIQSCCATYDYSSIPELVVTNGHDDWPLTRRGPILTA